MSNTPVDINEFPEFMTARQVAELFLVTPQTIRAWCKEGKFPGAVQPGRQLRIPKASVIAVLNEQYG